MGIGWSSSPGRERPSPTRGGEIIRLPRDRWTPAAVAHADAGSQASAAHILPACKAKGTGWRLAGARPFGRPLAKRRPHSAAEQGPVWDLGDLYPGLDDPRVESDLASLDAESAELEQRYKGKLAELDGDALAGLIERYEALEDRIGRVFSFAQLLFAAKRDDPSVGRFYQGVQERVTTIGTGCCSSRWS